MQFVRKFTRLLCGVVEAERQWLCVVGNWLIKKCGMLAAHTIDQIFHQKGENDKISIFVPKVADKCFITGSPTSINHVILSLNSGFELGKINKSYQIKFLGCVLSMSSGTKGTLSERLCRSSVT